MSERYTAVRVRELGDMGDWPWRYVVEGLTAPGLRKKWPWSKNASVPVSPEWKRLRHGLRDFQPMQPSDAWKLCAHYRRQFELEDQ